MSKTRKMRANELDGKEWTRYSISVWRDLSKRKYDLDRDHPAMFPISLVERLIQCFMNSEQQVVLDPFVGSGSTIIAARNLDKYGIGWDISEKYLDLAKKRLSHTPLWGGGDYELRKEDARNLTKHLSANSVDFCVTSPPYWNILQRKRSADGKTTRNYNETERNLGLIEDYHTFVHTLGEVFSGVLTVLKPGSYCVVNVMDIRKKDQFFPLHCSLSQELQDRGFIFDDLIIWDRSHEYNNLRPLGYPYVFRINKVHEYLLIFLKPKE